MGHPHSGEAILYGTVVTRYRHLGCQIDGSWVAIKQPLRSTHHPLEGAGNQFVDLVQPSKVYFRKYIKHHP